MPQLGWDLQYSVSIDTVDIQHKRIIEELDRLSTMVSTPGDVNPVHLFLEDIFCRIRDHFEFEEALMKNKGYPSFILHKNMHDAFLRQFLNLRKKWKEGTEELSFASVAFLKRWFVDHIVGADKLYTPYLGQKSGS